MNISDFAMRGNPEDMDDDFEPIPGTQSIEGRSKETVKGHEIAQKGPQRAALSKNTLIIIAVLVLSSSASFGFGLLAERGSSSANGGGLLVGAAPTTEPSAAQLSAGVLNSGSLSGAAASTSSIPVGGEVIASSATHSYYLPWCPDASKISKADIVWFPTEQMAKSAGYTPGANCPGI